MRNALVARPPSIGAATRRMISAPAPSAHSSGQERERHRRDRHQLGAQAPHGALGVRRDDVVARREPALADAAMERLVDVDHHDDAGLHREPDDGQQADPDRRGHRVAERVAASTRCRPARTAPRRARSAPRSGCGTGAASRPSMSSATSGTIQRSRPLPAAISSYWPVHSIRSPGRAPSAAAISARRRALDVAGDVGPVVEVDVDVGAQLAALGADRRRAGRRRPAGRAAPAAPGRVGAAHGGVAHAVGRRRAR